MVIKKRLILACLIMFSSCFIQAQTHDSGTMTGNDGKKYKTLQIGNQTWMAENLIETRYRNGDAIREVRDNYQWARPASGARCSYDNNAKKTVTIKMVINQFLQFAQLAQRRVEAVEINSAVKEILSEFPVYKI